MNQLQNYRLALQLEKEIGGAIKALETSNAFLEPFKHLVAIGQLVSQINENLILLKQHRNKQKEVIEKKGLE